MTLVQCIQDQASYYKKLASELKSESKVNTELTDIKSQRLKLEQDIAIKRTEIIALEENS